MYKESTIYNVVHLSRLIFWVFFCISLLIKPSSQLIGIHLIGLTIFLSISTIFHGIYLGWKKSMIPTLLDMLLSLGLAFTAWQFGQHFYRFDDFWIISCVISIPFIFFSGFLLHILRACYWRSQSASFSKLGFLAHAAIVLVEPRRRDYVSAEQLSEPLLGRQACQPLYPCLCPTTQ